MEDEDIIKLYWSRNQSAIKETDIKYGKYCKTIAVNILRNNEDAEECVNDTYLKTWNAIPPHQPKMLSTFLGKITRNLSFDKFRYGKMKKRGGGEINIVLDELNEVVSGTDDVEDEYEKQEMLREINNFLNTISDEKSDMFICRYWYVMTIGEISNVFDIPKENVSVTLNRIRHHLKEYLSERGYIL